MTAFPESEDGLERWRDDLDSLLPEIADAIRPALLAIATMPADDLDRIAGPAPRVLAASQYVADFVCRRTRAFQALVAGGRLLEAENSRAWPDLVNEAVSDCDETADFGDAIRTLRNTEAVRISWREIAGITTIEQSLADLSGLADSLIATASDRVYSDLARSWGTPRTGTGEAVQPTVFALGKLGGAELNFSSDIDIMIGYGAEGECDGGRSNQEFFNRYTRRLSTLLSDSTDKGYVFRVDLRLRPHGDSGAPSLPLGAIRRYYEIHGRDWERYALIKARPVAGDLAAGEGLLGTLNEFIYRRYTDYGAYEVIREMKTLIDEKVGESGADQDVKLGPGGIREVEFIVQSFQIARAGRIRSLQTPHLKTALDECINQDLIDATAGAGLYRDYLFLRRVEHALQMRRDQQTHRLPVSAADRAAVAACLDLADYDTVTEQLDAARTRVQSLFDTVFQSHAGDPGQTRGDLWSRWRDSANDETRNQGAELLTDAGFTQLEAVAGELGALRRSSTYRQLSDHGREQLDALMNNVLDICARMDEPAHSLKRIGQIVNAIGRRTPYVTFLLEEPALLEQLIMLVTASEWLCNWICRHPVALDQLRRPPSGAPVLSTFAKRMSALEDEDQESQMEMLREVHHSDLFRIAIEDLAGSLDENEITTRLTELAEASVIAAVNTAGRALKRRYGIAPTGAEIGIVAYGKLGSVELGYNSDLDIVFLYSRPEDDADGHTVGGEKAVPLDEYYSRIVRRTTSLLTTRTPSGIVYEIDMRLRPSGNSGTMVSAINAFADYQEKSAWTWEHQALVRARMFHGSEALRQRFDEIRSAVLRRPRDAATLRDEVGQMRDRMIAANSQSDSDQVDLKLEPGGIIDIEFIAQYLVLLHAEDHPAVVEPRRTGEILAKLADQGLLEPADARMLAGAFHDYVAAERQLKLMEAGRTVDREAYGEHRAAVLKAWERLFK